MFSKVSLTAAFLLIVAPPMACASTRDTANRAPTTRQAQASPRGTVVAQEDQPSVGTTDSDNDNDNSSDSDSDSNNSADQNQNADGSQTDQNAAGNDQATVPQADAPDTDPGDAQQAPQMNGYPQPQPVNPYQ